MLRIAKIGCILLLLGVYLSHQESLAQKFGYIDSEYILNMHPDYQVVQKELEALQKDWKEQARALDAEIKEMHTALKAEEVLLTEEMYSERLKTIKEKEKESLAFNNRVFGVNGLYFQKQAELLQPLQSKIYDAIDKVAKRNRLGMIIDKAASTGLIYTDPIHDYSEFVLEELGIEKK
ncbi:MAG: OmpH family outer membrane protein [Nitritalea sp.]